MTQYIVYEVWVCLFCVCTGVCKSNNITDHQQAMNDAVAAAMLRQTNKDVTEEPDTTAVGSDEQPSTDDHVESSEDVELSKEDLW